MTMDPILQLGKGGLTPENTAAVDEALAARELIKISVLTNAENEAKETGAALAEALKAGKPVVALESTIISHGMPYPQNVETALKVESIIREAGAVPATIAIIGGRLKAGLSKEEIDYLGRTGAGIPKASRRDLPVLVAQGKDGACTVTTTMMIADMADIRVFATGGIGGVHRGAQETFDISAALEELANTPVMVICAGAKSILDLGLPLEYLETHGVTVIGYGTSELPAFSTRKSGFGVDYELDTPEQLAKAFHVKRELGLRGGLLVTNPNPEEYSMAKEVIWIMDESKLVDKIGAFHLPVELAQYGSKQAMERMAGYGWIPGLRVRDGKTFVTDNGIYIADLHLGAGFDIQDVYSKLTGMLGVLEHGLFLNMVDKVIVGDPNGPRVMTNANK